MSSGGALLAAWLVACGGSVDSTGKSRPEEPPGGTGSGGARSTGGTQANGGARSTGGAQANGGARSTGGAQANGGTGPTQGGAGGSATDADADPPAKPDAGALTPLAPYDFCVARAKDFCALLSRCCANPGSVAHCEAAEVGRCYPDAPVPATYDPLKAARCLQARRRAVSDCHHARADTEESVAAEALCRDVIWLGGLSAGESCRGGGRCNQLPDRIVYCDDQSEGGGSGLCLTGPMRPRAGERCAFESPCVDGLACRAGVCGALLEDGSSCRYTNDCASGYCECLDSGPCNAARCSTRGYPVASESGCAELDGD